jgi:uncharacterized protein VirK/YbjX
MVALKGKGSGQRGKAGNMIVKNMYWLWANSVAVCGGQGFILATRRIIFFVRALAVYGSIKPIINSSRESPMGRLIECRPETVGAIIGPYQCIGWDVRTRLARIRDHYLAIETIGGPINFPLDGRLLLLDLKAIQEGLQVVLDHPKWFMREGQLVINLFFRDTRMYSLAFSLSYQKNGLTAFVGAIQGRNIEGILEQYRQLTKASHGTRPRDLLIEVFRMLCGVLGVIDIFAVSDAYRIQRSHYFGKAPKNFFVNYDEIWAHRGGVRVHPMFFRLDVGARQRDLGTIPAKKRGMYRRRYDMLSLLKQQMHLNYTSRLAPARRTRKDHEEAKFSEINGFILRQGDEGTLIGHKGRY